jgi:hypothetical protein
MAMEVIISRPCLCSKWQKTVALTGKNAVIEPDGSIQR